MQGITTNGLEVAVQMKNGETVHLLIAASPVRDKEGQITHAVEIMQDITPLKELENALRQSEEKYHTQFDAFSEATTVWDRNGFLLMQNLVSARNLDGKSEDFIGKSILEIFPGTGIDYLERIERVIDSGKIEYQEDTLETPAGMRTYWTCTQRIQSPSGTTAAQMIAYDITERRRIEDVLRSSEEKFSTVFHYAPYPISIIRLGDGVFLESNQAFCKILNQDHLEVIGQTWNHFGFTPMKADLNRIIEMMKQEGKVTDYELALDRPGLLPIVLLLSINPIVIGGKKCALLVGHDITERKLSEEALRLAQIELTRGLQERTALQERQRLARELHDSVSQVLYGISLGTHTALALFETERAKSLDALTYVLSLAQAGMTEMRALIFELRPESLKNEGLVNAINKQAAALRARHGIEVDLSLCEEPDISMDEKEAIYRITLEAIQNALKHARCSHINVDMRSDLAGLYLQVKDNGIGFDPAKNYPGHLGLQSMRERAANISAELTITSEIALGTCIQVLIPAKEPEVIVN
jgi:PAS domain S-box-containing protein